jgi:hypothetical protein
MKMNSEMTQVNEKVSYVHGLEEVTLSKCPYYPKQPTDSIFKCPPISPSQIDSVSKEIPVILPEIE